MSLLTTIGGIAGGAAGLLSGIGQYTMSERNLRYQKDTRDHNTRMQSLAWGREDNAVQRRVRDLKAAGLSPVLAAGSAAGSSGPIQVNAPQQEKSAGSVPADAISGMLQMSQLAQTLAQTQLTQAQTGLTSENRSIQGMHAKRFRRGIHPSAPGGIERAMDRLIPALNNLTSGKNFIKQKEKLIKEFNDYFTIERTKEPYKGLNKAEQLQRMRDFLNTRKRRKKK